MTTDLLKKLRSPIDGWTALDEAVSAEIAEQAAAEIERLEKRLSEVAKMPYGY